MHSLGLLLSANIKSLCDFSLILHTWHFEVKWRVHYQREIAFLTGKVHSFQENKHKQDT